MGLTPDESPLGRSALGCRGAASSSFTPDTVTRVTFSAEVGLAPLGRVMSDRWIEEPMSRFATEAST
jgi:hypothetical protein